jgi:hypothetical protein
LFRLLPYKFFHLRRETFINYQVTLHNLIPERLWHNLKYSLCRHICSTYTWTARMLLHLSSLLLPSSERCSHSSSVSIVTQLPATWLRFDFRQRHHFTLRDCVQTGWGPPSLLSIGYWGVLSPAQIGRGVKLTAHFHLVRKLKMRGNISPLPHTFLWRGVWLSTGTTLPYL